MPCQTPRLCGVSHREALSQSRYRRAGSCQGGPVAQVQAGGRRVTPVNVVDAMGLQIADALPDWLRPLARAAATGEGLGPRFRRPEGLVGEPRRSAVLILFGEDPVAGPDLLFVERAKTLRNHPGQPAFPGGKVDPGEGPVATALREANEETDLDPAGVEVFGVLPDQYGFPAGFLVTPVLGWWRGPTPGSVPGTRW